MIAILGATGYIGCSLAREWAEDRRRPVSLFARDPGKLRQTPWPPGVSLHGLADFNAGEFALVVNTIGTGDPARVAALGPEILDVSDLWDRRILDTMSATTRYVFLSSGAIYGTSFDRPAEAASQLTLAVNRLETVPPYTIAKLVAETRHRFTPHRSILDVRVFGYADRTISLSGTFFLAQLARSIVAKATFETARDDMIRDYAGARELIALITAWEASGAPNRAVDLYTRAPVAKSTLLDLARERYGLDFCYVDHAVPGPTGVKSVYSSNNRAAAALGYEPTRSAIDVVVDVLDRIKAGH